MKNTLLIWTSNPGKIERRSSYFGDLFTILALKDCDIDIEVEESMDDLEGNAIKKATTYATLSGHITLSEDTGFYIHALDGQPWPAVRRWGGELPDSVSDADLLAHIKQKLAHLHNPEAYFEYMVAIATPEGTVETISHKHHGYVDQNRLNNHYVSGYPLSNCFVNEFDGKTRSECTLEERTARDTAIIGKIKEVLKKFQ